MFKCGHLVDTVNALALLTELCLELKFFRIARDICSVNLTIAAALGRMGPRGPMRVYWLRGLANAGLWNFQAAVKDLEAAQQAAKAKQHSTQQVSISQLCPTAACVPLIACASPALHTALDCICPSRQPHGRSPSSLIGEEMSLAPVIIRPCSMPGWFELPSQCVLNPPPALHSWTSS